MPGVFFQSFCRLLNVQINHAILYGRPLKFFKKNLCSIVIIFWQPVLISPKTSPQLLMELQKMDIFSHLFE